MRSVGLFPILILGAIVACATEPTGAIDDLDDPVGVTEAELVSVVDTSDPTYIDALIDHAADTTLDLLLTMEPEDIERVRSGEITVQEAAGMDDAEFDALSRELHGLSAEAGAVLPESGEYEAGDSPYAYKGRLDCNGQRFRICYAKYLVMAGMTTPVPGTGVLAVGLADCLCKHCKGDLRNRVCNDDDKGDPK